MTRIMIVNSKQSLRNDKTVQLGNKRTTEDHPDYSIIKIDQMLKRVLETWVDLSNSKSSRKLSAKAGVKNSQRNNNNNNNNNNIIIIIIIIIVVMPLKHILIKCTAGYKLSRSQEKINHQMYMDDIKLLAKNKMNWKL